MYRISVPLKFLSLSSKQCYYEFSFVSLPVLSQSAPEEYHRGLHTGHIVADKTYAVQNMK